MIAIPVPSELSSFFETYKHEFIDLHYSVPICFFAFVLIHSDPISIHSCYLKQEYVIPHLLSP